MAKQNTSAIILLVIIGAAALLFLPNAISSLGDAWSQGWQSFWEPFSNFTGTGNLPNGTISGDVGVGFEIFYEDGTSETFEPEFSVVPFTILDVGSGKKVIEAQVYVYGTMQFSGTLSNVKLDDRIRMEVWKQPSNEQVHTIWSPWTSLSTSGSSPIQFTCGAHKFMMSDVENDLKNKGQSPGNYKFAYYGDLTATATFSDGATDAKTVTSIASYFDVKWEVGQITGLSITVGHQHINP